LRPGPVQTVQYRSFVQRTSVQKSAGVQRSGEPSPTTTSALTFFLLSGWRGGPKKVGKRQERGRFVGDDEALAILRDPRAPPEQRCRATEFLYAEALRVAEKVTWGTGLDPRDVVQEVFAERLARIVQGYASDAGTSFRTFLRTCVWNAACDARRRLRPQVSLDDGLSEALSSEEFSPLDLLISREDGAEELLSTIPAAVREVVRAFYLDDDDKSAAQIAADLGLTEAQVYRQLHRGRELLRRQLAIRMVLAPDDTLRAEWVAELMGTLQGLAKARRLHPITQLAAAGGGPRIQKLKPAKDGELLDALSGFLHWDEEGEGRWRLELKFWSRPNLRQEGNDPLLLTKFHKSRIKVEWCPASATKPQAGEVELRLDEDQNLVSTPTWLDIPGPQASATIKLSFLGRA
jgi:RNA polymerase sigma factor (sigma-70 family)